MVHVTVYAGLTSRGDDEREPTVVAYPFVREQDVNSLLREIGLEYKTADYFSTRQVVITIDPVTDPKDDKLKDAVRAAQEVLESGLS